MFLSLLNIINFPFEIMSGLIAGLLCKAYFSRQMKSKIKNYEDENLRNKQRINELEEMNCRLESRIKGLENYFSKDSIILN